MSLNNELMTRFQECYQKLPQVEIKVPYRVNPLGAHVDHQGGAVLGRTIDLYTTLLLTPTAESHVKLACYGHHWDPSRLTLRWTQPQKSSGWGRYAQAAVSALHAYAPDRIKYGFEGVVHGSLPGAGLSSSASVVLTYLTGLAFVNQLSLSQSELVELVRHVENNYLGLSNGVQDQTAIVYGRRQAMAHMDNLNRIVTDIPDAAQIDDVCWLLTYSGFSRELLGSGFNNRVAQCREAAALLDSTAEILCQVPQSTRSEAHLQALPEPLGRRARHFFTEIGRVEAGRTAWEAGDWNRFGELMNQSCHSSITQYESGSQPLIDLHEIVSAQSGVFGSRFCGGGYGGCLLALVEKTAVPHLIPAIEQGYLRQYPEKQGIARSFVVTAEESSTITEISL